jgi:hypothetical protein
LAVVFILKWIAVVAPIMTAISYAVQGILMIPEIIVRFQGAPNLADKIKSLNEKITYWTKLLSIRNAQKK